jgi:hypothetical protein
VKTVSATASQRGRVGAAWNFDSVSAGGWTPKVVTHRGLGYLIVGFEGIQIEGRGTLARTWTGDNSAELSSWKFYTKQKFDVI